MYEQFQRSLGGGFNRSPGQARNVSQPAPCLFVILHACIPICGFGTFTTASTISPPDPAVYPYKGTGAPAFNNIWPNVFTTMVETWSDSQGSGSQTTQYSQYIDVGATQIQGTGNTSTGPDVLNPTTQITSVTVNLAGTVLTIDYNDHTGAPGGVYTATVSNQYNVNSTQWATWTAQAMALLANFPEVPPLDQSLGILPPGTYTPTYFVYRVYPTQAAPGFAISTAAIDAAFNYDAMILAAAYGLPVRTNGPWIGYYAPFTPYAPGTYAPLQWPVLYPDPFSYLAPVAASIADYPSPYNLNSAYTAQNNGACVCSMSRWQLTGQSPDGPGLGYHALNSYNHLSLYAQQLSLTGSPGFVMNTPLSSAVETYISGNVRSYAPADVQTYLGSGNYGMLGFCPTAA